MRIVQVAPLEEPVPPEKYGGTELVVYNLVEETVKMGHEVYLLGAGDSQVSGYVLPIIPQSLRKAFPKKDEFDEWRHFLKIYHVATVIKMIRAIDPDIVHNHYGWRLIQFADFIDCPMYTTMHGPITSIHEQYTYQNHASSNYISISNAQQKAMPGLNWVKTIYNGINMEHFQIGERNERDYFAFLGRISPEKGLHEICGVIKQSPYKLKIAAKIDPVDEQYYEKKVKPFIDGEKIEYIGEVDQEQKVDFLKKAKGMLLWLNWEEPFGLAAVEAMATGTPVITNSRGSMPELVKEGKSGFLVNSLEEMLRKLGAVESIDPVLCRQHVEENFSSVRMAKEYLKLAGKLTRHARII